MLWKLSVGEPAAVESFGLWFFFFFLFLRWRCERFFCLFKLIVINFFFFFLNLFLGSFPQGVLLSLKQQISDRSFESFSKGKAFDRMLVMQYFQEKDGSFKLLKAQIFLRGTQLLRTAFLFVQLCEIHLLVDNCFGFCSPLPHPDFRLLVCSSICVLSCALKLGNQL